MPPENEMINPGPSAARALAFDVDTHRPLRPRLSYSCHQHSKPEALGVPVSPSMFFCYKFFEGSRAQAAQGMLPATNPLVSQQAGIKSTTPTHGAKGPIYEWQCSSCRGGDDAGVGRRGRQRRRLRYYDYQCQC